MSYEGVLALNIGMLGVLWHHLLHLLALMLLAKLLRMKGDPRVVLVVVSMGIGKAAYSLRPRPKRVIGMICFFIVRRRRFKARRGSIARRAGMGGVLLMLRYSVKAYLLVHTDVCCACSQ